MSEQTEEQQHRHETTYDAAVAAMRDLGFIGKNREADRSQGGYAFRGIEDLLDKGGPVFRQHGVLTMTEVIGDPIISSYTTSNGAVMNWVICKVQVTIRGCANPNDVLVGSAFGEAADKADKSMAKAYSVGYREALFKALSIPVNGEDYDTESSSDTGRASSQEAADHARAELDDDAKARGFDGVDDLEANWARLRTEVFVGDTESATWARQVVSRLGLKKGTLTASLVHELDDVLANAKRDGGWKAGYTPPAPEEFSS